MYSSRSAIAPEHFQAIPRLTSTTLPRDGTISSAAQSSAQAASIASPTATSTQALTAAQPPSEPAQQANSPAALASTPSTPMSQQGQPSSGSTAPLAAALSSAPSQGLGAVGKTASGPVGQAASGPLSSSPGPQRSGDVSSVSRRGQELLEQVSAALRPMRCDLSQTHLALCVAHMQMALRSRQCGFA